MCDPVTLTGIAVGAAIGAGTAAATGNDPLMGALLGGATGGFFPGSVGVTAGSAAGGSAIVGSATGSTLVTGMGANLAFGTAAQAVGVGLVGGALKQSLFPSTEGYTPAAQVSQAQALNMNTNVATTGSGGRQAAKSLATAISRSKKRKLTQRDVGDLSLDTSSFTNTGLQLA